MSETTSHRVIAFLGSPNSGKTTLFNWITGNRFKTVNYPGATVDYFVGTSHKGYEHMIHVADTPGTYSLIPFSPEEEVTYKLLFENKSSHNISKNIVVVVDATQLSRHLVLVRQAQAAGFNVTIALTMIDLLKHDNINVDLLKLSELTGCEVYPIDGQLGGGVSELIQGLNNLDKNAEAFTPNLKNLKHDFASEAQEISDLCLKQKSTGKLLRSVQSTENLDHLLLHPIFGLVLFAAIMTGLFTSIFWLATPFMDALDSYASGLAGWSFTQLGEGVFADFISNGIIASFGAVIVFVPQIFILFVGIGLLEDSGYLARAASLIDKPLSMVGLNGRSFVPILSGFACAVPAMMAARTIGSKKERWITLFIIPFMTCSARLPVYALLLSFLFFGSKAIIPGIVLAIIYIGSLVIGGISAAILNRILKAEKPSAFMLELPLYRKPKLKVVILNALSKTYGYIKRAGPIIFVLSVFIWLGTNFPNYEEADATVKVQTSYLGQAGHAIEPLFEPMGVDWRVGVGLLSAFAAREVFVSTLAIIFNITDGSEEQITSSLIKNMQTASFPNGELIFTPVTVIGLILFFMFALQCISTTGVAIKEMKSVKFALYQLVAMNVAAYFITVIFVQSCYLLGFN